MEKIQSLTDSFVDFEGKTHKYTIVAISVLEDPCCNVLVFENKEDTSGTEVGIVKSVRLGISICNPDDEWDEKIGYSIALQRARNNMEYALYATKRGMINTQLVTALLSQESNYIKNNPSSVISSYKELEKAYREKKQKTELYSKLPDSDKSVIDTLKHYTKEYFDMIMSLINV